MFFCYHYNAQWTRGTGVILTATMRTYFEICGEVWVRIRKNEERRSYCVPFWLSSEKRSGFDHLVRDDVNMAVFLLSTTNWVGKEFSLGNLGTPRKASLAYYLLKSQPELTIDRYVRWPTGLRTNNNTDMIDWLIIDFIYRYKVMASRFRSSTFKPQQIDGNRSYMYHSTFPFPPSIYTQQYLLLTWPQP